MLRIVTLNLNGIRSAWNKGASAWLHSQSADVICFQELKAQLADLSPEMINPQGFHAFYHCAEKKGYSGVGLWSRQKPVLVVEGLKALLAHEFTHPVSTDWLNEFHAEGRYLRADFDSFSVISLYLPSGSSSPERQDAKFRFIAGFYAHLHYLDAWAQKTGRKIILCGDLNIAHQNIDLKNWKSNQKNSGFLPEERAWMSQVLEEAHFVDAYRSLYPETTDDSYTWWSNRGQAYAKNVGWRLDYQLGSANVAGKINAASVYKSEKFSDHAPLMVDYDF